MLVTIFADAGRCPNLSIASWGGWAKSERGVARAGGVLKIDTPHTTLLEAAAVVNAMKMALIQKVLVQGDKMILQTDNNMVENVLMNQWKGPLAGLVYGEFVRTCMHYELDYEWRHVEGHKGSMTPRNSVNSYCDRVCTFFLRLERHRMDPERYPHFPQQAPFGIKVPTDFEHRIKAEQHRQVDDERESLY